MARVQVLVRACDLDFHVADAAHAAIDGRNLLVEHRSVRDQDDVAGKQALVRLDPFREGGGAHLFLTFKNEFDVVPELPGAHQILKSLDMHERLALVVVCPAGVDGAVTDLRLEGVRLPEFQRIDGHDVVVAIDQDRRRFGIEFLFPEYNRVPGGLIDGAGLFQQFDQPFGATVHVRLVGGFRTDGRNAEQREQFLQETLVVLFNVLFHNEY